MGEQWRVMNFGHEEADNDNVFDGEEENNIEELMTRRSRWKRAWQWSRRR
jgi:hypothetical protein